MTTFHLTISAVTADDGVIGDLISEHGPLHNMPERLNAHAGLISSSCHIHVIEPDTDEPDVDAKVQALIDYLGADRALEALEGMAYDALNDAAWVSQDAKAADREAGEAVIRASNGEIVRRIPVVPRGDGPAFA